MHAEGRALSNSLLFHLLRQSVVGCRNTPSKRSRQVREASFPASTARATASPDLMLSRAVTNQSTFSPDGTQLVEHRFGSSSVWDLTVDPPSLMYVSRGWGQESCASFSPDGRLLTICSQDNAIRVIDAHSGERFRTLEGHAGYATSVSFSYDGETLVSVGSDSTVRIWDVESGQLRTTLDGFEQTPWRVALSPRGDSLASVHGSAVGGAGGRGELLQHLRLRLYRAEPFRSWRFRH